jgi:ATP synthase protein I
MALTVALTDTRIGLSLLWGFSVCLLPAACFTWYATKYRGARVALATVNGFYRAEAVKFVLTAILFALVFQRVDQIQPAVFFFAFVVAQICSWVLVALTLRKPPR